MIIVVDFDGTLCRRKWPDIGEANEALIGQLKECRENGDRVILSTCRTGEKLDAAVDWCADRGLEFDAVNENLQDVIDLYGEDSRKITGDVYLDDRAVPFIFGERLELAEDRSGDDGLTERGRENDGRTEEDGHMERSRIGNDRQVRAQLTRFETREEEERPHISGYFSVFDGVYEIGPGMTESVDRHAFDNTLGGDIRALTNHDTTLVLGRTKAHTLELRTDEHGLWGDVTINPNDQDAVNLFERVKRGDVDQCSFGFNIVSEETEFRDDGSIHWRITEVELHEVSVCTFPAYEDTNVSAREAQRDALSRNRLADWKQAALARLHKEDKADA